jgi:hypothetical protein
MAAVLACGPDRLTRSGKREAKRFRTLLSGFPGA